MKSIAFGLPVGKGKADVTNLTCANAPTATTTGCSDSVVNYSDQCGSGNCACLMWTCTIRNPFSGNGAATMEISVDIDNGAGFGTTPDCYPFVAQFLTATTDAEATDLNGSICDPVMTTSTNATVAGGWQLIGWSTDKITNGAGGGVTGTFSLKTGELKLTLKGRTF